MPNTGATYNYTGMTDYGPTLDGASQNAYLAAYKDIYLPNVVKYIHMYEGSLAKAIASIKDKMIGGRKSVRLAQTGLPQSAGVGRFEGHDIATPRTSTFINPEYIAREQELVLQWTMEVEDYARGGNYRSWVEPVQRDMEGAREAFTQTTIRKLNNGPFDVLSTVASWSSPTATLYPVNDRTSSAWWKIGLMYHRTNQSIGVVDTTQGYGGEPAYSHALASTLAKHNERYISSQADSSTAPTITFDTALTSLTDGAWGSNAASNGITSFVPADGDYIIAYAERAHVVDATAADAIGDYQGLNGLDNVCSDGTTGPYTALFGLSKTTAANDALNGNYYHNSGTTRTFTERYLGFAIRKAFQRFGARHDEIRCHPAMIDEVGKENRGDRIFGEVLTKSGQGKLSYTYGTQTLGYTDDWMTKPGCFYMLNSDDWGGHELRPLSPVQPSPRFVANKRAHQVVSARLWNVDCERPGFQSMVDDIAYDDAAPSA